VPGEKCQNDFALVATLFFSWRILQPVKLPFNSPYFKLFLQKQLVIFLFL